MMRKNKGFLKELLILSIFALVMIGSWAVYFLADTFTQSDEKQALISAGEALESNYSDYIISNVIETQTGAVNYLDVQHDEVSYSEYEYTNEDETKSEDATYVLNNWLTKDNLYYTMSADEEGNEIVYKLPDSYSVNIEDRRYMDIHTLLDGVDDVNKEDNNLTLDLGNGEENFTCYKFITPADNVKKILGANTWGYYNSLLQEKDLNSNIKKLCEYYLEDLDTTLTFSDAKVTAGVDSNNILKYLSIETGGGGYKVILTKFLASAKNDNVRPEPDFSKAIAFSESLKDIADYVASFSSYEEAIKAYQQSLMTNESEDATTEDVEDESATVESEEKEGKKGE